MLYALLGPFLAFDVQGESIAGLAPRQRQLLALLLLNANIVLHRDRLIDLLWNGRPPDSARRNLTTHIARLHRLLSPREPGNSAVGTVGSGYALSIPSTSLDVEQFNCLTMRGRTARDNRDYHNAAELLEDALRLWRGDALLDLRRVDALAVWADRLDGDRRAVTEDLFDVRLTVGQHHEIVNALAQWASTHPLRERPHRSSCSPCTGPAGRKARRMRSQVGRPSSRAMSMRWTSLVPSPISRIFASR
ncbi:AfsR/SARP family transcriptional regulator [Microbispora amethystogenes]|uniref:OmpR/PhoB-type domain-containing protein n=1 Tax=Microbispora amethystogenes TaxID=1427754 RepID=A0ABQ4FC35_9ACTN|nr:BTAD domain-containing putative transcriptional regulator [Microbispora amethystogenes]GIH32334.1 hypothetical protein Mam01_24980 [Microbispora amethystogenes]